MKVISLIFYLVLPIFIFSIGFFAEKLIKNKKVINKYPFSKWAVLKASAKDVPFILSYNE